METATRKWLEIAEDDWGVAQLAFSHARYLHAVVMAQQAVEKVLKALIAEATNHIPPKKHQLTALANEAGVWGN